MKTLTIKDLARTEELDRTAMAAVRGGFKKMNPQHYSFGDFTYAPSSDSSIHADQSIVQMEKVVNATANDAAFLENIHVTNHNSMNAENKIIRR